MDTIIRLAQMRAASQPSTLAYTFLEDGKVPGPKLTYEELDWGSRRVGAAIQALGVYSGRILVICPPNLEFIKAFFGCLYAGCVAVPAHAPHPALLKRIRNRLENMARDAQPQVVLTTSKYLPVLRELWETEQAFKGVHWLTTDGLPKGQEDTWRGPSVGGQDIAFLQYSSGSTALPKGVMVSHENILYNLELIRQAFEHTEESRGVIWLPPYHDMGLIGGILQPLYVGFPVTLMSPLDFLKEPYLWLKAISETRATTSGGPNFAYDLCVRTVPPEQRDTLDLSCWDVAFNGAEPVRLNTLEKFAEFFAPCGFRRETLYPCYGLAEATLMVSGGKKGSGPASIKVEAEALESGCAVACVSGTRSRALVGCGRSPAGTKLVIVDPMSCRLRGSGEVGEIWVSGPGVAIGYWNRPEDTEATFKAYLATEEGPFLRTGDLGFLKDGELFITGRLKDLIIIHGRNYYPEDIESTVEGSHSAIKPGGCVAFSVDQAEGEGLVILAEVDSRKRGKDGPAAPVSLADISKAVRQAVSEQHDLQVHELLLLKSGSLPKTSSGKVQRHACRAGFLSGDLANRGCL